LEEVIARDGRLDPGSYAADLGAARRRQLHDRHPRAAPQVGAVVNGGVSSNPRERRARPLLGLRRQPGRAALWLFRLPLPLYHRGCGWLLGRTFLLLVHEGRKTGNQYGTVAMVLSYDPQTREAVICSVWGPDTDWIRNIHARPALRVQIGRESFTPQQRFLTEDESVAVALDFRRRHPGRFRLFTWILGWDDLRSDDTVRDFVRSRPFVAVRPSETSGL
jgi:deazaflavin-dependent oxidoreductase (nitroreductase family)